MLVRGVIAPDASASRSLPWERGRGCRQVRESSQTLVATDFVPCLVQSFKLVAIPVESRVEIAETGECQRQNALLMRERQLSRIGNRFAQRRTASDLNWTARQPQFCYNPWR